MSANDLFHGGDRPRPALEKRLDELFHAPGGVPGRWVPRRLVLQNYWLFPYQEFHFGNGRLVLRGPNGSGKTSVLVSAVTLALDGARGRSRLDPFGQGGRSMAYYLLGKAEAEEGGGTFYHEDRTGYVALELQHGADGRFLTVGVGMRGRRLSGEAAPRVDSWAFVVRDGRRVGRERELELTTGDGVPLTRSELAERLGTGGVVVERVSDYQTEVNRALFGFPEDEDFRFLLQILLSLRSPKLNKELKPTDVAEILSDSLPALDPTLLDRVTQIMDDIDATRADVALTEERHGLVERVHGAVGRYANQVAQALALDYRERDTAVEEVRERLVHRRQEASALRDELGRAESRLREADRERADLRGRLRVLRNHEAYRSRDALESAEKDVARAREHLARVDQEVQSAARDVADREKRRSRMRDHWTRQRGIASRGATDLTDAARQAAWPHAEQRAREVSAGLEALEVGDGEPPELRADALSALAAERRGRLERVVEGHAGVIRADVELERAGSVVEEARAELKRGHDGLRSARDTADTRRDELGVRLERWQGSLRELPVRASDVAQLREQIHGLGGSGPVGPSLFEPWLERARRRRSELVADRDAVRARLAAIDVRRHEVGEELRAWEAREEAVPEPRPGQGEARANLAARGVVAVPLFRAVEVRSFVPEAKVRSLHAALRESGLLDALVVGAGNGEAVAGALRDDGGDRWIRPSPLAEGSATLADLLEPASCDLPASDVMAALRSIALEGGGAASTEITADGAWTLGVIEGRASGRSAEGPMYLGREARVRERDDQVRRLQGDVADLDDEAKRERGELERLGERMEALEADVEDLRALPEMAALSDALTVLAERSRRVEGLKERLEEAEALTKEARRAVGKARQVLEAALREAPDARGRDADGVRELIVSAERVVTVAERVADRLDRLREAAEELRRAETEIERRRDALEGARARFAGAGEIVAEAQGRARTIQTELAELGLHEIVDEVEKAEKRDEELDAEGRELAATISGLTVSLEHTDAEVARLEGERTRTEGARAEARTRLAEAVHAYPTLEEAATLFGDGSEGSAARAVEHLLGRREERPTDLARRIDDDRRRAHLALAQEVSDSRSALIEYQPNLDSDTGAVSFRHEGREVPPHALLKVLARHRQDQEAAMRDKEDELYEEFFLQEVSGRIREAIERGEESVERVNELLTHRPLANDEILTLRWRPRREIGADGADHPRLVELLKKPASVLPPEDVRWIKSFFRQRVRMVREGAGQDTSDATGNAKSFAEALRAVLDYRSWFAFSLHGKRPGEALTEITNREFATRSGGEKSLAMFVPLLAAVDARFRGARADAPKLVGLDEAFAGVDSDNINEMFAFMVSLDLSWIMTSEKLFGVGASLPACTTYQFHRRGTLAAVQPWLWDGRHNAEEATLELIEEAPDADATEGSGAA